jgi:hypothetical protein
MTRFSQQGLHLRVRLVVGTHLGWFLGGGSGRRVVRDGARFAPTFGDGHGPRPVALWLDQDNGHLALSIL